MSFGRGCRTTIGRRPSILYPPTPLVDTGLEVSPTLGPRLAASLLADFHLLVLL
jgi:hypothetical protein